LHEDITNPNGILVLIGSRQPTVEDWDVASVWHVIKLISWNQQVLSFNLEIVVLACRVVDSELEISQRSESNNLGSITS